MSTPRLIIVDDDPLVALIIVEIARHAFPDEGDLETECVLTPDAAMLAIRRASGRPGTRVVVMSDLNLPPSHLTGLDILADAKARLPDARRVLMTGVDPLDLGETLLQARLDAFVPKPFGFDEMRALLVWLVEDPRSSRGAATALRIPVATSVPQGGSIVLLREAERA
ncbi:MAG TPA: response regulator [Candidatus Thermoplasmatota archaeon]|nr:response regulator [Candidatus Thermoplasmatota archaeon]